MVRAHRLWRGALTVTLGLGLAAGCEHSQRPTPGALLTDGGKTTRLSARQVADVQFAVGRSAEQRGEFQQATAAYQQALKQDPSRTDAMMRLAILHDRQGQFRESAELYRKALAAQPGHPQVYANLGYSLYLQGHWADAEMNLRQALVLEPTDLRAHNNLGLVLARTGRGEEALAEFRKGGCNEADAHCNVAFALSLEHRLPEARQHYQLALVAAPSDHARKGLQQLERLEARRDLPSGANEPPAVATAPTQEMEVLPVIWKHSGQKDRLSPEGEVKAVPRKGER